MQSNIVSSPTALANTAASATVTGAITAPVAAPVGGGGAVVKSGATAATISVSAGAVLAATMATFLQ